MVAEILQYIPDKPRLRPIEADALYSGILVDTDNFVVKAGVRTFEAAAYLRRAGADVTRVRKMFRSGISEMKERAQGISNAEIYLGVFALSYIDADPNSPEAPTVPVAKVANELLNVDGIKASFVVTENKGTLYVSARSIGDVNVQLVMEHFNGGGHANIAGVQLKIKVKSQFGDVLRNLKCDIDSDIPAHGYVIFNDSKTRFWSTNQFNAQQCKALDTPAEKLRFDFIVAKIVYSDGTVDENNTQN
jgi:c-di-AMP phosphodiesterase-like protein